MPCDCIGGRISEVTADAEVAGVLMHVLDDLVRGGKSLGLALRFLGAGRGVWGAAAGV